MRFKFFVFLVIVMIACKKKSVFPGEIIGHAGMGLKNSTSNFSENSSEAFYYALSFNPCSGVEMDVQLSASGSLWAFHDETLQERTNGESCVGLSTDAQLSKLHYRKTKQKLLKLKDFDFSAYPNKIFFLDIRHFNTCTNEEVIIADLLEALQEIMDDHPETQFVLKTSYLNWINPFLNFGKPVFFVENGSNHVEHVLSNYPEVEGFDIKYSKEVKDVVKLLKNENKLVCLYEIRAPKTIRAAGKLGADYLEVDDLVSAINILSDGK